MMPPLVRHDPLGRWGSQRADRRPAARAEICGGSVSARCTSPSHLTIRSSWLPYLCSEKC